MTALVLHLRQKSFVMSNKKHQSFTKTDTIETSFLIISGLILLVLHFIASLNDSPLLFVYDSWRYLPAERDRNSAVRHLKLAREYEYNTSLVETVLKIINED